MTPIDFLLTVPLIAFFTFIWGSMQTEEVDGPKSYKQQNSGLWVEQTIKVKKPKYPELSKPVLPDETST